MTYIHTHIFIADAAGGLTLAGPLIGATVSFVIFALSQWILFKKSHSDLLRAKLEELWKCLIEIKRESRLLPIDKNDYNQEYVEYLDERASSLSDSLLSPTPFVELYFPMLKERYFRVSDACEKMAERMRKAPSPSPQQVGPIQPNINAVMAHSVYLGIYLKNSFEESIKAIEEIGELLTYLREHQSMLIRTPQEVIAARWDKLSSN